MNLGRKAKKSMSCWVVPSLAAEYLGISIEELQYRLQIGNIPTKSDHGFLFVDVAPGSPMMIRPADPPATFVEISAEEMSALTQPEDQDAEESDAVPIMSSPEWAGARQSASQLRRRPAA